ncbi:MAG: acyl-CoA dehydrogenase family protein [Candidatus Tectomicrobia bacterium]|uniref:Acyl-CoA dehydrogenase family protein n=1 Tax=Tectimicrobiota bacterium TaxID=2528274 RepID=A0A933EAA2_UNCTE|nr:acyl-CoA dehydrogenase family protein [Candidatus Tectomicrobia bacterium]
MDFGLTETQLSLRQLAHEFAEKEIRPLARERERIRDPRERFPWDILEKGSKLGLRTLSLPEERGGAGASILDLCIVGEEIAWGDLGVAVTFDQTWKIIHFLDRVWNEEQRARFLPAFLGDHRFHLAVGVTEPDVGSENFTPSDSPGDGVRLRGVREGDHWVLNGMKHFISNGGIAKLYVIVTRTDPKAAVARGVTYFMVTPGTKGFSIGEIHDKMGQRLSQNAELIFENCRVPDADRVTEVGGGVKARAGSFSRGSVIESAATALGPARAAYEDAVEYARNRVQGGKPIIQHQAVGFMLADCFIEYQAARQTLHYAAWMAMKDEGYDPKLGYMAKAYASEACFRIAKCAMEVWGGMGYMTEAPMEKYLRDVTSFLHSAGTNEAQHVRSMPYL